jgi:hypothetical protein
MPARVDRCPGQMDGHRSIQSGGRKTIRSIGQKSVRTGSGRKSESGWRRVWRRGQNGDSPDRWGHLVHLLSRA